MKKPRETAPSSYRGTRSARRDSTSGSTSQTCTPCNWPTRPRKRCPAGTQRGRPRSGPQDNRCRRRTDCPCRPPSWPGRNSRPDTAACCRPSSKTRRDTARAPTRRPRTSGRSDTRPAWTRTSRRGSNSRPSTCWHCRARPTWRPGTKSRPCTPWPPSGWPRRNRRPPCSARHTWCCRPCPTRSTCRPGKSSRRSSSRGPSRSSCPCWSTKSRPCTSTASRHPTRHCKTDRARTPWRA
jgi:hypothetical protein